MGSSLVGYHCIGPVTIPDDRIAAARKRGREVVKLAKQWQEADEKGLDFAIPSFWADEGVDELWQIEHIAEMDDGSVDAVVDRIVDYWNRPGGDSSWRDLSDATKVVFTGTMTWGDEPEDEGFQVLKEMFELGISKELGIF